MQAGKIDQAETFAQIKAELKDSDDYNDAEIKLRLRNRYKKVKRNEFSHDFVGELTKLADDYYKDIIESGEV